MSEHNIPHKLPDDMDYPTYGKGESFQSYQNYDGQMYSPKQSRGVTVLKIFAAIAIVIGGFILGVFIGGLFSWSACWKKDCSGLEESYPSLAAFGSLIFTLPVAFLIVRKPKL